MGYLAVSKIPYSKWLKFMLPLFGIWTALGCLFMLGVLMIGSTEFENPSPSWKASTAVWRDMPTRSETGTISGIVKWQI